MKTKTIIYLLIFCFIFLSYNGNIKSVYAIGQESSEYSGQEIEDELSEDIKKNIDNIDFSILEESVSKLNNEEYKVFGESSFIDKITNILNGSYVNNYNNIISAFLSLFFSDILNFIPIISIIICIVILSSFISSLRSNIGEKSVNDIVHFACFSLIIILISKCVIDVINVSKDCIMQMKIQMQVLFPILLTLMTAIGSVVSVNIYEPAVSFLTETIMEVFTNVLIPIFIFSFVINIVSNLSSDVSLNKFDNFLSSTFKWILGIIFTIFFAFLSIQGISANSYDSISIRTTKYAIKSYVPLMGGYLSEGMDLILTSSILIKNAVGVAGIFLIISTIFSPIIKIIVLSFGLKLTSSILEPISDKRISTFLFSISKNLNYLTCCILGVAFSYLITVGLIMCTGNIV
jgi:stage III sporulation protein AE